MSLSSTEVQQLIERYRSHEHPGMVNYNQFIRKINTIFAPDARPSELIHEVKSQAIFTDAEKEIMLDAAK